LLFLPEFNELVGEAKASNKVCMQELDLTLGLQHAKVQHGDALWRILATLSKLTKVKIRLHYLKGAPDQSWAFFFQSISVMSQVRWVLS